MKRQTLDCDRNERERQSLITTFKKANKQEQEQRRSFFVVFVVLGFAF
jgi:hypothetical protein